MAETTAFELVTPDALWFSDDVKMVVIPGAEGDFGVMAKHSPMVSTVRPGVIKVYKEGLASGVTEQLFVAGGFAEVTPERTTVLAEEAVKVAELDASTVQERQSSAQKALDSASSDGERNAAQRELSIADALQKALN